MLYVDARATAGGDGSERHPHATIQAAADAAGPGCLVLIAPGVYRERLAPPRSGEEGRPITFRAVRPGTVAIRGSDVFAPAWTPVPGQLCVFSAPLHGRRTGTAAYAGRCDPAHYASFDPTREHFNRRLLARPVSAAVAKLRQRQARFAELAAEEDTSGTAKAADFQKRIAALDAEIARMSDQHDPLLLTTLAQLFIDGHEMDERERPSEVLAHAGSWIVDPEGEHILLHLPDWCPDIGASLVELTARHTVVAPLQRGIGWIALDGLVIEHGANHFPCWGKDGWPQVGILDTRSGHHWTVRDCTVRLAKGIGLNLGQEGDLEVDAHGEFPRHPADAATSAADVDGSHSKGRLLPRDPNVVGHHVIERCAISDNGHCGIAGIMTRGLRITGNRIERNNRHGLTSPWWEFAGIKLHFCFDAVIEGNLVRDNDAHGIWLDNTIVRTRVTRNVVLGNRWSGINIELSEGPVLIDNNIVAGTIAGDGIYGHDCSGVSAVHNLLFGNAGHGAWFAWCTPRMKPGTGCDRIVIRNNIIASNSQGAVGLPFDWHCAGNNQCDGNLYQGHGVVLDEGSGPFPPRFVVTNTSHCAQFAHVCPGPEVQTASTVTRLLHEALVRAGVAVPDLTRWHEHFTLPLDLWRATTGHDLSSRETRPIRDGLNHRAAVWTTTIEPAWGEVACERIPGVGTDFRGRTMPQQPHPGPWQDLAAGPIRLACWPVPGIASARPI